MNNQSKALLFSVVGVFGFGMILDNPQDPTGLAIGSLDARTDTDSMTEVDVMVVYTPGVTARYNGDPETRFNHLINVTNQVYSDSDVDMALRLVHSVEVDYPDNSSATTALQDITFAQTPAFSDIEALRETHGADMVVFYRPYHANHGGCGIAWIGGYGTNGDFSGETQKNYAYSHVAVDTCQDYVTAHELGHNMGLAHSRIQDGAGGTLPYALGHGEHGNFVTIMAYQSAFSVDYWSGKVYKFSNPDLMCNGSPCGIDKHEPTWGADASATLRLAGPQVADYFPTKLIVSVDPNEIDAAEQAVADAQLNLDNALADMNALLAVYQQSIVDREAALNAYYDAYGVYQAELSTVLGLQSDLNNAIAAFNASYGQPYSVRLSRYNAYVSAYNAFINGLNSYYASIDVVNQAVASFYEADAAMQVAQQNHQNAQTLVAQYQVELNEAELFLAQLLA